MKTGLLKEADYMLILQRRKGESLKIGENITVSISDMGADWVKLAIDAPNDIKIMRAELIEAAGLNKEAANLNNEELSALKLFINKK